MTGIKCFARRGLSIATLVLVAIGLIGAVAPANAQQENTLEKILTTKVLTVGVHSGDPPWTFTLPDGSFDGYQIALAKLLASDLGAELKMVDSNSAGRIPALQSGRVDVVIASLNYTAERARVVAFTQPYAHPLQQFLVAASSSYQTVEQLNDPSVTLGASLGGVETTTWPKLLPKAQFKGYNSPADAQQALVSGRVTATGDSTIVNAEMMATYPGRFRILNPPYAKFSYGMAVRLYDPNWLQYLNRWIDQINYQGQNQALWTQYIKSGTPLGN